ncbi:MAG: S-adenosyl-l-methionine hydroxide adenosyltransferase family protein [Lacibacter sp.]
MPLITLTTDFGEQDYLAGAVKGTLLQHVAHAQLIDITHSLTPFNDAQTAYVVSSAIRHFPAGTFHLVLANLFMYPPRHMLLVQHNGQYLGIADNGLITMILEETPQKVVALPLDGSKARNTLQCVQVLARAISALQEGAPFETLGSPNVSIRVRNPLRPLTTATYIEGQIIHIDQFENVVVNITHEEFEAQRKGRSFRIVFKRDEMIDQLRESYADVPEGEKLAYFNAAGYLEIAINKGNAAGLFGLLSYTPNSSTQFTQSRMYYETVRVYFE